MEAYFSGDIPPLKKVEAFLHGKCGGTISVRAYLHIFSVEAYFSGDIPPLKESGGIPTWKLWRHIVS